MTDYGYSIETMLKLFFDSLKTVIDILDYKKKNHNLIVHLTKELDKRNSIIKGQEKTLRNLKKYVEGFKLNIMFVTYREIQKLTVDFRNLENHRNMIRVEK